MIPFFVVDRRVSLEILKGLFLKLPDKTFGLMGNVHVSNRFIELFRDFPYGTALKYCDDMGITPEDADEMIRDRIVRFADSGVFQRRRFSYEELFIRYEQMGTDYGSIVDFIYDPERTLESAEAAMRAYRRGNYGFKLVGVAQGVRLEDYIRSWERLKRMGYEYIAIGGLLKRTANSNFLSLRNDSVYYIQEVVSRIRENFGEGEWIFLFGAFSPRRAKLLKNLGIYGADYKGWLYHYEDDYSFVPEYLSGLAERYGVSEEDVKRVRLLVGEYASYKRRGYRLTYFRSDDDLRRSKKIRELKGEIDRTLKKYGLNLQFFRFMRTRDRLYEILKGV